MIRELDSRSVIGHIVKLIEDHKKRATSEVSQGNYTALAEAQREIQNVNYFNFIRLEPGL